MECLLEKIVSIGPEHVPAYRDLRLRGLQEHPEAFGETAQAFKAKSLQDISEQVVSQARAGGFILGAFSKSGEIVGCVGLSVKDSGKSRHRGFLWGMYVLPEARGQRVGRLLLEDLLARARALEFVEQVHLAVVTSNEGAVRLYHTMGFETYGTDPRVLNVNGRYFDEYLMVKRVWS